MLTIINNSPPPGSSQALDKKCFRIIIIDYTPLRPQNMSNKIGRPKTDQPKIATYVKFDKPDMDKLRDLANQRRLSISALVRMIVCRHLDNNLEGLDIPSTRDD